MREPKDMGACSLGARQCRPCERALKRGVAPNPGSDTKVLMSCSNATHGRRSLPDTTCPKASYKTCDNDFAPKAAHWSLSKRVVPFLNQPSALVMKMRLVPAG